MTIWPMIAAPGRKIGYARVSTKDQRLRMQRDGLNAAGCDLIFEDHGAAGEYTSQYLGYFLVACIAYAFAISLFINDLASSASKDSPYKSGRTEIYLQFYLVLILYVLPTVLWESNRLMGYC